MGTKAHTQGYNEQTSRVILYRIQGNFGDNNHGGEKTSLTGRFVLSVYNYYFNFRPAERKRT